MDWRDNQTCCIKASASAVTKGCLKVHASRIGEAIRTTCTALGGIVAQCQLLNPPFKVSCSLVCGVSSPYYLRVSPTVTQWITEGEIIEYEVRSNVDWEVE